MTSSSVLERLRCEFGDAVGAVVDEAAVIAERPVDVEVGECFERSACAFHVGRVLWFRAVEAVVAVVGDERVAGEEEAVVGEVQRDVPGAVPGRVHHVHRTDGRVQCFVADEFEVDGRGRIPVAVWGCFHGELPTVDVRRLVGVCDDEHVHLVLEGCECAGVVAVVVREDDGRDLGEREPGGVECFAELRDGAREADVDEDESARRLDGDGVEFECSAVVVVGDGEVVHAIWECHTFAYGDQGRIGSGGGVARGQPGTASGECVGRWHGPTRVYEATR